MTRRQRGTRKKSHKQSRRIENRRNKRTMISSKVSTSVEGAAESTRRVGLSEWSMAGGRIRVEGGSPLKDEGRYHR